MDFQEPEMCPSFKRDDDCTNTKEQNDEEMLKISGLKCLKFISDKLQEPLRKKYGSSRSNIAQGSSAVQVPLSFEVLPEPLLRELYSLVSAAYHFGYGVKHVCSFINSAHNNRSPKDNLLCAGTVFEAFLLLIWDKAKQEFFNKGVSEGYAEGIEEGKRRALEVTEKHTDSETFDCIVKECETEKLSSREDSHEPNLGAQEDIPIAREQTPESDNDVTPYTPPPTLCAGSCASQPAYSDAQPGSKRKRTQDDIDDDSPISRKVWR